MRTAHKGYSAAKTKRCHEYVTDINSSQSVKRLKWQPENAEKPYMNPYMNPYMKQKKSIHESIHETKPGKKFVKNKITTASPIFFIYYLLVQKGRALHK
jgi:hypothetical protein